MTDIIGFVLWSALAVAYALSVRLLHRQSHLVLPMAVPAAPSANVVSIAEARRLRVKRLGAIWRSSDGVG